MTINFRYFAGVLALSAGLALNGAAAPLFQEHEPDYSKNKTYQQGAREGKDDKAHGRDHYKKRHFKKDEDQRAYEAGYQHGRGN